MGGTRSQSLGSGVQECLYICLTDVDVFSQTFKCKKHLFWIFFLTPCLHWKRVVRQKQIHSIIINKAVNIGVSLWIVHTGNCNIMNIITNTCNVNKTITIMNFHWWYSLQHVIGHKSKGCHAYLITEHLFTSIGNIKVQMIKCWCNYFFTSVRHPKLLETD